ncbi:MAG TPA: SHOCT domain-containing protein [bacterium]|nr:SHOCT domain-containing protein [bacterium]
MRSRWLVVLMIVAVVAALGGAVVPGVSTPLALAQQGLQLSAQSAPAPSPPGGPQGPGTPSYGPGYRGYGPGFGPGYGPGFRPGRFRRGGFGAGRGIGIAAGFFGLLMLLRFLLLIALLVIAWKVITAHWLWGRRDGTIQIIRSRFARGEITEEEYRKLLAAL